MQRTRIAATLALCIGIALFSGCAAMGAGNGSSGQTSSGVTVSPGSSTVRAGDTQQFTAKVTAAMDQTVVWSVNGVMGGNSTVGTISTAGLYKAPAALPTPDSVSIEATSSSDKTLSGKVMVMLENPVPTVTAVSPTAVPVGNFTLTITGSKFVNGAKVMFAGQTLTTKFVSATQLTATGTTTSAQNGTSVQVSVVNPDPGSITSSTIMVKVGASGIVVRLSPPRANLRPGETVQFKATITGTTNPNVVWKVNSAPGGNTTVGTISTTGLYTAPAGLTGSTVTIGAPSVEDPQSNNAPSFVTLLSNLPVVTAALPAPLPVGNFTIAVSGTNFLNGAQVIFDGVMLPTTFVSATSLSASGNAASAGTIPLQVINPGAGSPTSNILQVQVGSGNSGVTSAAAARLLEQSTFGPTPASIQHVQTVGMQSFLNEQYAATASTYPAPGANDDITVVKQRFFTNALTGQDQLRQRVAWSLAQTFVVSNQKIGDPSAFTSWMNMLQKDAFGNFSTLLNDVTLSPTMGHYLDMVRNDKPDPNSGAQPNENYAREILQLFSVGLAQLNPDGTPQVDGNGVPLPTYTQDTIIGFAHVFTGWAYPTKAGQTASFYNGEYYGGPMIPFDNHHDTGQKLLLNGVVLGSGGTTQSDLTAALQNIFTHPNVGPFISKQLIQHLVTSNPSPAYVSRVTAVFNDNGSGVRGDMKAVVNAILMDSEARRGDDPTQVQSSDGHLKEPVLFMMNLLRATNATSDGANLQNYASDMKEEPFESPTVFNFYPPDNGIPGTTLLGPEFRIFNSTTAISRINFVNDLVYGSVSSTTKTDISAYVALASNPPELVDSLSNVLTHGPLSDGARNTIITTVTNLTDNTKRARTALYLIGSSSQFQVAH
ncbi:MAG TPA: DUF1800 domain-containing protein [Terriglobales bacterium]|nr:DUF1800 domain-containing protein [Terriglobales bacterium]